MFQSLDLTLRQVAATLPSRAGYALTRTLTPLVGGKPRRWVAEEVERRASEFLADPRLAKSAGERFVTELACDDLDAITSTRWPEPARLAATTVHGENEVPVAGPAVFTSFHFSGGFRIFDVLRARGLTPTFVHAPPRHPIGKYQERIERMRRTHLENSLPLPFVRPGRGARERLDQHLAGGGVVVALLDVAPQALELRDRASGTLLGRTLRVPVGLLRLALAHDAPVIPYDGRLEDDQRVLEFHPRASGTTAEALLQSVLDTCERVVCARPWTWQAWLDAEALFEPH